jgi:uncharacterized protein (DUF2267 family)
MMALSFNQHAVKGNQFINQLMENLPENNDKIQCMKMLRALFHTLRDYLTLEESFQLLAQLPVALKGIYVDGWSPMKKSTVKQGSKDDFIREFMKKHAASAWCGYANKEEVLSTIKTIFKSLKLYVSDGEFEDMEAVLPKQLKPFLREAYIDSKQA